MHTLYPQSFFIIHNCSWLPFLLYRKFLDLKTSVFSALFPKSVTFDQCTTPSFLSLGWIARHQHWYICRFKYKNCELNIFAHRQESLLLPLCILWSWPPYPIHTEADHYLNFQYGYIQIVALPLDALFHSHFLWAL